jgi:putative heme-binding domain-containing protein
VTLLTILVLALALAASSPAAQENKQPQTNPVAGDARAIELGRVMFRMSCAGCHGLRATGGRSGPDLTRGTFAAGNTDADLYRVITDGVPGTEMPAFASWVEPDERWRLISYVRSLAPHETVAIPGDAAAGEQLFWGKGGCGRCHRAGARGTSIGPNLTRAGRQRSLAYLRESVVSPDADVSPGYATITVVTRDGKTITGVEKGFDNFSTQLMDLSGRFYSFQKDEVTSVERQYRSLMPPNYGRLFSDHELQDLLAFLAGLRGDER